MENKNIIKEVVPNEYIIRRIMGFGYTREEAINVHKGLNPDGTESEQLPF